MLSHLRALSEVAPQSNNTGRRDHAGQVDTRLVAAAAAEGAA